MAATANFLAIDTGDIVYCAKELTRHRATPTTADWEQVVRLARYLKNRPRVPFWHKFQETPCQLETYSDTDWAGCRRTRRSTTGGYTVAGSHLIKMRRQYTYRHCTYSAAQHKHAPWLKSKRDLHCHLCAPEKNLVIWCHMSHPWLSHLPFTTNTSSSSSTLPSTTQEHAAQSVQQEQLREHFVDEKRYQRPETRATQLPQNVVQNTSCCGSQFSGSRIVRERRPKQCDSYRCTKTSAHT